MTYKEYCQSEFGYTTLTTYFEDFSIAEHFGKKALEDTYESAIANGDYKWLTELSMVLNHKIWFTYKKNETLARIYNSLWEKCNSYIYEHFNEEELEYFYKVTD